MEFQRPQVKFRDGKLRSLKFVATNDTLLNLSLDNLCEYLRTTEELVASDADSIILSFRVDSRQAEIIGDRAAGGLRAVLRLDVPGHSALEREVTLNDFSSRSTHVARARLGLGTVRGRSARLRLLFRGLNRQRKRLMPVLTHVHYIGDPGDGGGLLQVQTLGHSSGLSEPGPALPTVFPLHQNYPNPFNPTTVIRYDLPEAALVRLRIFNIKGQQVRELVAKHQVAGEYKVAWDSRADNGLPVAAGAYFYRIDAGHFGDVKRLLLLK